MVYCYLYCHWVLVNILSTKIFNTYIACKTLPYLEVVRSMPCCFESFCFISSACLRVMDLPGPTIQNLPGESPTSSLVSTDLNIWHHCIRYSLIRIKNSPKCLFSCCLLININRRQNWTWQNPFSLYKVFLSVRYYPALFLCNFNT